MVRIVIVHQISDSSYKSHLIIHNITKTNKYSSNNADQKLHNEKTNYKDIQDL